MFQTSYIGVSPLQKNYTYVGGFCQFWIIPVEDVAIFPRVNPANQWLIDEPSLKAGKSWFGPIRVPKNKIGYSEELSMTKAGPWYHTKVEGVYVGESADSRINFENMPYHRYLLIGKVRAGGYYHLIGTDKSPCSFDAAFKSGSGPTESVQTSISFTTDLINKAFILPSFNADQLKPADGGAGGGSDIMANQKEIIIFSNSGTINIPWTSDRLSKFGTFPIINVYVQEDGDVPRMVIGGNIEADSPPPAFTELSVKLGGTPSGFVVIE